MQPKLAGKITGMLLEMDSNELFGLIDNDDKLREKVDEALTVYDEYVKNAGEMAPTGHEAEGKTEEVATEAEAEPVNA